MSRILLICLLFITTNCFAVIDGNIPVNVIDGLLHGFNAVSTFIHLVLLFFSFSLIFIYHNFKNKVIPNWCNILLILILFLIIFLDQGTHIFSLKICLFFAFLTGISFFAATYVVCSIMLSKNNILKLIAYIFTLFATGLIISPFFFVIISGY